MTITNNLNNPVNNDMDIASPVNTLSRAKYPKTLAEVLGWAEELWMHHGMYSQAIRKAVRYFCTDIEVEGDSINKESKGRYEKQLKDTFDLMQELGRVGDDYVAFGNSFTSLHIPIIRNLTCTKCGLRAPASKLRKSYKFSSGKFSGKCPKCHKDVTYKRDDTPVPKAKLKPVISYWPPQYMEIVENPVTRTTEYSIRICEYEELYTGVTQGHHIFIEELPWEIIEAIAANAMFKFEQGQIFHMKTQPITSLTPSLRGWGLPLFMAEFETALLVHMLDKYTEAIVVDYLVPFRVLTPTPTSSGNPDSDPMLTMDMQAFSSHILGMLERHTQNPTGWNFLPVPLQYQVLGGEAKSLIPVDLMEFFEKRLLYSMGIPPELYKDGANASAGPILTFKMFEKTWQHFVNALNAWLTWLARRIGEIMNWGQVKVNLVPVQLHEDPTIREIKLSLAASNEISRDTAYRPLGIDLDKERAKIMQEEEDFNEEIEQRQKALSEKEVTKQLVIQPPVAEQILAAEQAEQEQAAGGGMPPPAGMPMPTGPAVAGGQDASQTLEGLMNEAQQMAQQIYAMPSEQRRSQLINLAHTNETLHAQVKAVLTDMDRQAEAQGRMQGRAQAGGQQV